MSPNEYAELAMRTAPDLGTKKNIIHAGLGLVSEVGELADMLKRTLAYGKELDTVNIVEESGDMLWYMVLLCKNTGTEFESLMPKSQFQCDAIDVMVLDLSNYAAWVATQSRNAVEHDLRPTYQIEMWRTVVTIDKICRAAGYKIEDAMRRNIAKLARRYPEGFAEWRALNRDLVAEREVLEGGSVRSA